MVDDYKKVIRNCGRLENGNFLLKNLEKEYGKDVHICFIDYSKAFDCINHELLWKTLLEMGIPKHLIQLLKRLYEDQSVVIRTEFVDTDRFKIKKE